MAESPLESILGDATNPWALPEQEPSAFICLWPGETAPTVTEVTSALAAVLDDASEGGEPAIKVMGEIEADEDDVQWVVLIEITALPAPLMVWCEPSQPVPPGEIGDARAERARWAVGVETLLGADDPLTVYTNLMRLLSRALPDIPAILDVNCATWRRRAELDDQFVEHDLEPPADEMWIIHAVQTEPEKNGSNAADHADQGVVWLHTHGLWRCGRPELEMLEVPASHRESAATLLNEIARLVLESPGDSPLPPPGEPLEVGSGLQVVFQPWPEVAQYMADAIPGSRADRERTDGRGRDADGESAEAHLGVRAVVCAPEPRGRYKRLWTWPAEAAQAISESRAVLYLSERATLRQAAAARARWDQLATAFASTESLRAARPESNRPGEVFFVVKAGFERDGDGEGEEHLWFLIVAFHGREVEGELLNQPLAVSNLEQGQVVRIDPERVTDWQVQTPHGLFGPDQVHAMWRALDDLRAGASERTRRSP